MSNKPHFTKQERIVLYGALVVGAVAFVALVGTTAIVGMALVHNQLVP